MARDFDAVDDKIIIAYNASLALTGTAFSIGAWIYPDTDNVWEVIIGKPQTTTHVSPFWDWSLLKSNSDLGAKNRMSSYSDAWDAHKFATTAVTINAWNHVAVTYDGSNIRHYLNGDLNGTVATTGSIANANSQDIRISSNRDGGELFNGRMAGIFVYNATLTLDEINRLMLRSAPKTANLQLWMELFGVSSPESDWSGNGNNGTLTGTVRIDHPPKIAAMPFGGATAG